MVCPCEGLPQPTPYRPRVHTGDSVETLVGSAVMGRSVAARKRSHGLSLARSVTLSYTLTHSRTRSLCIHVHAQAMTGRSLQREETVQSLRCVCARACVRACVLCVCARVNLIDTICACVRACVGEQAAAPSGWFAPLASPAPWR